MSHRAKRGIGAIALAVAGLVGVGAQAQTTSPTTNAAPFVVGPLQIHVTAVQGGGQYRLAGETKWHVVKAGQDLTEGAEFRTGPKGTIQFTVGSDQVYRVDRLTVLKVVRATLLPNGVIKTDVGMTYGRVSKDVDQPDRPHDDQIIAPSSTLAVRGTRVSVYDQPPYNPELTVLTGTALGTFPQLGRKITFGTAGGGKSTVDSQNTTPADFQIGNTVVSNTPGEAQSAAEQLTNTLALAGTPPVGIFSNLVHSESTSMATSGFGSVTTPGELFTETVWQGSTPFTEVEYSVKSPLGEVVDHIHQSAPSGGQYNTSDGLSFIADSTGFGAQLIDWFTLGSTTSSYPSGKYTITQTLLGTTTQTLQQNPGIQVTTTQITEIVPPGTATDSGAALTPPSFAVLSATSPTAVYTINVPFPNGTAQTLVSGQATTNPNLGTASSAVAFRMPKPSR